MNQKASSNVDFTENSFILINKNKEIVFFKLDQDRDIESFFSKKPRIGEAILETISITYRSNFEKIINSSLSGNSLTFKEEMTRSLTERPFVIIITCSPIYVAGELVYINCTIGSMKRITQNLREFDDYSKFASHELRPPITNILSLSNLENYPKMKNYDISRIQLLLNDIYQQAAKLDNVIMVLNGLINDNEEVEEQPVPVETPQQTSDLVHKHIILIDDEPIVNRLHSMLLKKYADNRIIKDFTDSQLGLQYVLDKRPDLIFLDLNMPKINGWEFLRLIEQHSIRVDIIIVSSSIDEHEKIKAKAYPFVKDFLSKPLTSESISAIFTQHK